MNRGEAPGAAGGAPTAPRGRVVVLFVRLLALGAPAFVAACALLVALGLADHPGHAAIAIVPGNTVRADGRLSGRLESRCRRALEVWRTGWAPVLFVSGAVGHEGQDEAAAMKRWLLARGVPDSAVVTDSRGDNSWLTARHARAWLDAHGGGGAIIVTQGFHVPRMRLACSRAGIRPIYWTHSRFFEPRDFYSIAREIPGLGWYAIRPADRD